MNPVPAEREPLRVLCVTNMWPRPDHPAYGTFVESQMRSMADRGISVRVHIVDGRRSRLAYLRSALRMLSLNLGPRSFDVIHAHTGHCGLLAQLQRRYPVVVSFVGYDVYGTPTAGGGTTARSRIEAFVFRFVSSRCARTITKSARMQQLLPSAARGRNAVLPNGVDRELFRPLDRDECRRRLGWPADELTVLFAGNPAVARKRHALAAEAFELARAELPQAKLRVLWGVDPRDVPVWMNASDLVLLTSLLEGSPNVVKEAVACNVPVVATRVGDVDEVLADIDGCHVTSDDPEEIGARIAEVLRRAPLRTDGRAKTPHLELHTIADRLEAIYRECLS